MTTFRGIPVPNRHGSVTPGDSGSGLANGDLPHSTIFVVVNGTVGDLALVDAAGTTITYASATVTAMNQVVFGQWVRVNSTNTTATGIVAHWYDPAAVPA